MAESRRLVKVFLASPGDLSDERKAAKLVVDEFNALLAEEFGYQVELVGWEDTVSVFGRPQATINRELERCELFIGMMWKHWGMPPDISGPYSSGFEEEFKRSVERRMRDGRPEISLLFKEVDPEFLRDPGDGLKRVLAFKNQLIAEKMILFENFTDIRDFETKLRRCITRYIRNLRAEELSKALGQSQSPTTDGEKQQAEEVNRAINTPLSAEGAKFLRDFISKTERATENDPISAVEIARFRLLTTIVKKPGNDEYSLGVHDANLIFTKGSQFKFGSTELHGLLASGLDHFSQENVPLWRWLTAVDGFSNNMLPIYSIIESLTARRVNALNAMRFISEPLPSDPTWDRDTFLNSWFATDATSALKVAALNYLGGCGITSDLTIIRQELDRNDNQTNSAAADAFIRINLRESRERAISALYDLQPTSISRDVLAALFDNPVALSIETLLGGVGHQNSDVRRTVVKLLRARRALPTDIADQLLADSDATVRCEALKFLFDNGRSFSEVDAKKILIKPAANTGLALFRFGTSDPDGEACWADFRQVRLHSLKDKELEELASEDPFLDPDPHFVLIHRQFKQRGDDLRKAVDDQYKEEFSKWLHEMAENFTGKVDLLQKVRSLEKFTRKELTRKSLDVICQKADQRDLGRIREAIRSGFVDYSATDIEYLRKFGEWEDITLIIDSLKRPEAGRIATVLSIPDPSKYKTAAQAIYVLGRSRLDEVLTMPAPGQLLSHLIAEISDKAFRDLTDLLITHLLRSEDDTVRKCAALKCVRSLPKKRVAKLLDKYISGDASHYYNVIHWLDFGISTPRERTLSAAEKILNNEWKR